MSDLSVLYDAPGPKAKRNATIGSVVVGLALLAVLYVVYARLDEKGQWSWDLWGPLLDPSNEVFELVWQNLGTGLRNTLTGALVAITLSLLLGVVFGVARVMLGRWARIPVVGLIEILRGLPVIVMMFMAYQLLPALGVNYEPLPGPDAFWYMVVGLTLYNLAVFAEILRSGVNSLPKGQREAGLVIGLTPLQTMVMIQLPQAFRTMLPAIISQMVVVLKDTSLIMFLGQYPELLYQAKIIYQDLGNTLQTLVVVGIIFIAINFALSQLAVWVEKRMSRRSAGKSIDPIMATTAAPVKV
ncbi:amino acid ABC transporter permease [Kineosporia babensis]|uniref:Amino acid ABC transporter permease n=1 Tax=Kineosporia babensis TaxID=499548 RepID=A0A9X1SVP8_9ACTN|nr:amino acid ABC transporter permease [Kineosporia babensis]MCD5313899.1 amino acid ABC transporter permease [Kineosporia babensis]